MITLRAKSLHRVVAGQIASVQPSKYWTHGGHPYLSGQIVSTRIDAAALGLVPPALRRAGDAGPPAAFEMELPVRDAEDAIDPSLAKSLGPGEHADADELAERLLETDCATSPPTRTSATGCCSSARSGRSTTTR